MLPIKNPCLYSLPFKDSKLIHIILPHFISYSIQSIGFIIEYVKAK